MVALKLRTGGSMGAGILTQIMAQHMGSADEKLNDIQKSTKSKLPIILTIIGLIITASGVSVRGIYNNYKEQHKEDVQHEIYLYSEYSKVTIGVETNITATLNFDTDSVTITAYLASGKTDTLAMQQKIIPSGRKEFTLMKLVFIQLLSQQ